MKKFLVLLVVLVCTLQLDAQTNLRAIWDYSDVELPTINRFEVKVDTGNWVDIGIPAPEVFSTTLAGHHSYVFILTSVSNGPHAFYVRACDATQCSFEVSSPYKLIGPPKNPRVER
jgi:hypothetical protein